jgi:hypothetical protein
MSGRESLGADDGERRNFHRSARAPPATRRHAGHTLPDRDTPGHSLTSRLCRVPEALADGGYGYLPHYNRFTSEYLAAALPLGFQVRHCEELRAGWGDPNEAPPPVRILPEHPSDIWTLQDWCPVATQAARNGDPVLIIWHFQLVSGG